MTRYKIGSYSLRYHIHRYKCKKCGQVWNRVCNVASCKVFVHLTLCWLCSQSYLDEFFGDQT